MTLDEFLSNLHECKHAGSGYTALCPAHDDSSASLSISEGEEGRIIIKCHAGCDSASIVHALNLTLADLFPERSHSDYSQPTAIYSYVDEANEELFQAVRFKTPTGKSFRQRHLGDDGEWVWNLQGVRRVLYRLPDVISAVAAQGIVFITEGEKDADALIEAMNKEGVAGTATCNPMGAGKWRPDYVPYLMGAYVCVVQDRDEPGRNHADIIRESLQGVAARVTVLQAKKGKDAYDHLAAGLTLGDFVEARQRPQNGVFSSNVIVEQAIERLSQTIEDLPEWEPLRILKPRGINLSFRPGRMYLLGGYTGEGKTAIALQITRQLCEDGCKVGYGSLEMGTSDLLNRLLEHVGIPLKVLERPWTIPGSEWEPLYSKALEEIRQWSLDILFQPSANADYFIEQTMNNEYDFLVVDHVHRFSWGSERRKLEDELTKLTNLALMFNIPVLILAQLRRFQRGPGMDLYPSPTLQDFRETEALGNEAARAMAVWREREPNGQTYSGSGVTHLIVLKDRYGPLGSSLVKFDGERQLFLPFGEDLQEVASATIHPSWQGIAK